MSFFNQANVYQFKQDYCHVIHQEKTITHLWGSVGQLDKLALRINLSDIYATFGTGCASVPGAGTPLTVLLHSLWNVHTFAFGTTPCWCGSARGAARLWGVQWDVQSEMTHSQCLDYHLFNQTIRCTHHALTLKLTDASALLGKQRAKYTLYPVWQVEKYKLLFILWRAKKYIYKIISLSCICSRHPHRFYTIIIHKAESCDALRVRRTDYNPSQFNALWSFLVSNTSAWCRDTIKKWKDKGTCSSPSWQDFFFFFFFGGGGGGGVYTDGSAGHWHHQW